MVRLLYENRVKFDSFVVQPLTSNAHELCEASLPQKIDANRYDGASVYMCPDCIEKYSMRKEADFGENEPLPEFDDCDEYALTCCVDGCSNLGALDVWLNPEKCTLIESVCERKEKLYKQAIEKLQKNIKDISELPFQDESTWHHVANKTVSVVYEYYLFCVDEINRMED